MIVLPPPAPDPQAAVVGPPTVRRTADYVVSFKDGAAVRVDVLLPGGGYMRADRFVGGDASGEARMLAEAPFRCAGQACRTSCAAVSNLRPFARLRRFDAQGRRRWTWSGRRDGDGATLAFLGFWAADCLSPNGRYLAVDVYDAGGRGAGSERGAAVLRLSPTPAWTPVPALGSVNDGVIGWRRGARATLIVERDAREVHDGPPRYVDVRLSE